MGVSKALAILYEINRVFSKIYRAYSGYISKWIYRKCTRTLRTYRALLSEIFHFVRHVSCAWRHPWNRKILNRRRGEQNTSRRSRCRKMHHRATKSKRFERKRHSLFRIDIWKYLAIGDRSSVTRYIGVHKISIDRRACEERAKVKIWRRLAQPRFSLFNLLVIIYQLITLRVIDIVRGVLMTLLQNKNLSSIRQPWCDMSVATR